MILTVAVIRVQNVSFAVVLVKRSITANSLKAEEVRKSLQVEHKVFPELPLILASQDSWGRFQYSGRRDIVNFLCKIDSGRIPWKKYRFP